MSGLDSIIESLYLKENLTTFNKVDNIIVNPISLVSNKTIIINKMNYPISFINELVNNGNRVISRIKVDNDSVIFDPYDLRINENIYPLGYKINVLSEDLYESIDHLFKDGVLYYPKPIECIKYSVDGYLTVIGYLAYQVGYDVKGIDNLIFRNLDVLKFSSGINNII